MALHWLVHVEPAHGSIGPPPPIAHELTVGMRQHPPYAGVTPHVANSATCTTQLLSVKPPHSVPAPVHAFRSPGKQGPSCAIGALLVHAYCLFQYVMPSHPHTGSKYGPGIGDSGLQAPVTAQPTKAQ